MINASLELLDFLPFPYGVRVERLTLPSYSRLESTSGAMYAGVPTVDLGLECRREDYKLHDNNNQTSEVTNNST